jgi:beta-carotene hydroxylase
MSTPAPVHFESPPSLNELGEDLIHITTPQRVVSLTLPFVCVAAYFACAMREWWLPAIAALVLLSFFTYGSVSHDLVHRNLGLPRHANDWLLAIIELLTLRSGHAYRLAHLHHHARYPHDDDLEGAAAKMTWARTLLDGITLQPRIWWWALHRPARTRRLRWMRGWIFMEGLACLLFILVAILLSPVAPAVLIYVVLIIVGSWIIPLITSRIPHDPAGQTPLLQTRAFRGAMLSVLALEHLYHLEHHLYPSVPHHNWARLAKQLDPYLEKNGVRPIKLWF